MSNYSEQQFYADDALTLDFLGFDFDFAADDIASDISSINGSESVVTTSSNAQSHNNNQRTEEVVENGHSTEAPSNDATITNHTSPSSLNRNSQFLDYNNQPNLSYSNSCPNNNYSSTSSNSSQNSSYNYYQYQGTNSNPNNSASGIYTNNYHTSNNTYNNTYNTNNFTETNKIPPLHGNFTTTQQMSMNNGNFQLPNAPIMEAINSSLSSISSIHNSINNMMMSTPIMNPMQNNILSSINNINNMNIPKFMNNNSSLNHLPSNNFSANFTQNNHTNQTINNNFVNQYSPDNNIPYQIQLPMKGGNSQYQQPSMNNHTILSTQPISNIPVNMNINMNMNVNMNMNMNINPVSNNYPILSSTNNSSIPIAHAVVIPSTGHPQSDTNYESSKYQQSATTTATTNMEPPRKKRKYTRRKPVTTSSTTAVDGSTTDETNNNASTTDDPNNPPSVVKTPNKVVALDDPRRTYTHLLLNTFNSCDVSRLSEVFQEYLTSDCIAVHRYEGVQNPYGRNYSTFKSRTTIFNLWKTLFKSAPDFLFTITETRACYNPERPEILIVASRFSWFGTRVMDVKVASTVNQKVIDDKLSKSASFVTNTQQLVGTIVREKQQQRLLQQQKMSHPSEDVKSDAKVSTGTVHGEENNYNKHDDSAPVSLNLIIQKGTTNANTTSITTDENIADNKNDDSNSTNITSDNVVESKNTTESHEQSIEETTNIPEKSIFDPKYNNEEISDNVEFYLTETDPATNPAISSSHPSANKQSTSSSSASTSKLSHKKMECVGTFLVYINETITAETSKSDTQSTLDGKDNNETANQQQEESSNVDDQVNSKPFKAQIYKIEFVYTALDEMMLNS